MLKFADYAAINLLFKNGYSKRAIARLTCHDRETVNKVLQRDGPVTVQPRSRSTSWMFREPLAQQLKARCATCDQLLSFLRSLGFNGSKRMVQQFVREFRERQIRGKLTAYVPFGSSLLTESHHWMLRLMQGDVSSKDLQADIGQILSTKDSDLIIETLRSGQVSLRNRALSVAAHLKGIASRQISQFLMLNRQSVREYIKRFRAGGLEALFDFNRKKVKKAENPIYKEAVFKSLHSPPRLHGFNRTTWRMQDLRTVLAAQGLRIAACNIRKIIRDAGYRFRKAKKVLTSNDPNYWQKLRAITDILRNLKPDEKFFSVDEFGPFAIKTRGGRSLVKSGEIRSVPQFQISKGTLIVTGGLEMSEN
jgi:transposase